MEHPTTERGETGAGVKFRTTIAVAILSLATPAAAIDICSGGNRAERRVTCVVDGDTIWHDGVKMRLLEIDTPETYHAQCDREKQLGEKAKLRLQSLMCIDCTTAVRKIGLRITVVWFTSSFLTGGMPEVY
jgi:endonuclease YncB( thermonuclease family)